MVEAVYIYKIPYEQGKDLIGYSTWSKGQPITRDFCDNVGTLVDKLKLYKMRLNTRRVFDRLPEVVEKDAAVLDDLRAREIDRAILQMLAA